MENHVLSAASVSRLLSQPDRENENRFIQRPCSPRTFPEIDLSHTHIGEAARETLSLETMRRLRVVPFDYDPHRQMLKVACADPFDPRLVEELTADLHDVGVELYVARPEAVDRVVAESTEKEATPDDRSVQRPAPIEEPFEDSIFRSLIDDCASVETPVDADAVARTPVALPTPRSVLFVAPNERISGHLLSLFRAEQIDVVVVGDCAAAGEQVRSRSFEAVFVDEALRGAVEAARPFPPSASKTTIRYFRSEADLLTNDTVDDFAYDLAFKNLAVVGRLYGGADKPFHAHARIVARLADTLGRRFELSSNLRLAMVTAAFFHNLAETHLTSTGI